MPATQASGQRRRFSILILKWFSLPRGDICCFNPITNQYTRQYIASHYIASGAFFYCVNVTGSFKIPKEFLVHIKTSWWIRKCSRQSREENSFYRLCILYNTRNPCPSTNHGLIIGSFPGKSRCSITTVIQLWFPQVTDPENWAQHLMLLSADICTVYLCRTEKQKTSGPIICLYLTWFLRDDHTRTSQACFSMII